jgi:hypothetical protein
MWAQPCLDLTGEKYGRLTPLKLLGRKNHHTFWLCRCECGKEITAAANSLRTGNTKSCGCFQRDKAAKISFKHGMCDSSEYGIWASMKRRCLNKKDEHYPSYGGRGIYICDRWLKFENFYADMGPRPKGRSIDRINNDGNYEPGNCRWATALEQVMNRRPYQISEKGRAQRVKNMRYARQFRIY